MEIIPFVHVLSADGEMIGLTDQRGQFVVEAECYDPEESETNLLFQHISYQKQKVNFNRTNKSLNVYLGPIELGEVQITDKAKAAEYLVLYGFFRSYQIENNIPKFYSDGFAKYYIPPNYGKYKLVSVETIEHRTFQNQELVDKDKLRTFSLRQDSFGPPFLYERPSIENLKDEYELSENKNHLYKVIDEDELIGQIVYDSVKSITLVDVDINLKDRLKVRKAFGYRSIFERKISSELYSDNIIKYSKGSYDNLKRCSQYRKLHFKHKSENDFRVIEWVHEFYTLDRHYISEDQFSQLELTDYGEVKYSSNIKEGYDERVKSLDLPDLPGIVSNSLGTVLTKLCDTCD